MCNVMWLLVLFFIHGFRAENNDSVRLVHRQSCYGASDANSDMIGCAESAASVFEHSLTPATLWCNATVCVSRFGAAMQVHSINCDAHRCSVLLHCDEKLLGLVYGGVVTVIGLGVFVYLLFRVNASIQYDTSKRL
jgi:hypothetical protein